MKVRNLCVLALCFMAVGAVTGLAQGTQRGPSGELSKTDATRLIDAINHVEADSFSKTHVYVSLEKLPLERITTMQKAFSASQIGSGSLKDHNLRLIASADGKHYLLAILPIPSGCGFSMFSDETANIFEAPQLDCSDEH